MSESKKPVWSPVAGRVVYALREWDGKYQSPYGNRVYLKITKGDYHGYVLLFAHLESFTCKDGQEIKAFDQFGVMGTTGANIDNVHLHVSLYPPKATEYKSETAIDPTPLFQASGMPTVTAACNPWGSKACAAVLTAKGLCHEGVDFSGLDANINKGNPRDPGLVADQLYLDRLAQVDPAYLFARAEATKKYL